MHLYYRNVNDAFQAICRGFLEGGFECSITHGYESTDRGGLSSITYHPPISRSPTRYGEVLVINEPVTITYSHPLERVLFNQYRDANPFFHMIEALWTLAGRDDIEPLKWFNSKVGEFSDDGKTWWGAYGKRWTDPYMGIFNSEPVLSQVDEAIKILTRDRTCRRVVLQQWMPYDLSRLLEQPNCKDVPCNTEVMFLPRRATVVEPKVTPTTFSLDTRDSRCEEILDMTVINRSNDMLWGALGSNYVTFSMLHEYVARAAGYEVGVYNQFTNNLHVYVTTNSRPEEIGHVMAGTEFWSGKWEPAKLIGNQIRGYSQNKHFPLGEKSAFDDDLKILFSRGAWKQPLCEFNTNFMNAVVKSMLLAWNAHKRKDYHTAIAHCLEIGAADWQVACCLWMERRMKKPVSLEV